MELNICLYCEKRLAEDNMSFCSKACEANEANKEPGYAQTRYESEKGQLISHVKYMPASSLQQITYHRRRSLSFKEPRQEQICRILSPALLPSSSSSSLSSSSLSDGSFYSCNEAYTTLPNPLYVHWHKAG